MFLPRRLIDGRARFDMSWKHVGDAEFAIRLLPAGARAAHIPRYLAEFPMPGSNVRGGPNARSETTRFMCSCPRSPLDERAFDRGPTHREGRQWRVPAGIPSALLDFTAARMTPVGTTFSLVLRAFVR